MPFDRCTTLRDRSSITRESIRAYPTRRCRRTMGFVVRSDIEKHKTKYIKQMIEELPPVEEVPSAEPEPESEGPPPEEPEPEPEPEPPKRRAKAAPKPPGRPKKEPGAPKANYTPRKPKEVVREVIREVVREPPPIDEVGLARQVITNIAQISRDFHEVRRDGWREMVMRNYQ